MKKKGKKAGGVKEKLKGKGGGGLLWSYTEGKENINNGEKRFRGNTTKKQEKIVAGKLGVLNEVSDYENNK